MAAVGALACAAVFGGAGESGATRTVAMPVARQAAGAVVWVWRTEAQANDGDAALLAVVERLVECVTGDVEAARLAEAPEIAWWDAGARDESVRLVVGIDLNTLRAAHAERFADQRLNDALHELGVANARGVVIEVGERVEMVLSYRAWGVDEAERVVLSPSGAAAGQLASGAAIRPEWMAWIQAGIACQRAMLEPIARSPFDARRASWERRHGQKLRQVASAMEGPIVFGEENGDACVMVRLGARADEATVLRLLGVVIEPVCDEIVMEADSGRARIRVLAGTEFERVRWRVVERERRRWIVVTRQ